MSFFFVRAAALTLPVNSWKFFWFRGGRTISKICLRRVNGLELRPFEITLAQCWQKRLAGTTRFKWYEKRTDVFCQLKSYYILIIQATPCFSFFCDLINIKSDLSGKTINYLLIKNFLTNHIDNEIMLKVISKYLFYPIQFIIIIGLIDVLDCTYKYQ